MLDIASLIVTQHELRYLGQIPQMVEFIRQKGVWNKEALTEHARFYHPGRISPLIQISRFPDGQDFIHDGHHRIATTWLGGRKVIYPEEYEVTEWTYELYLEINLSVGWVTPFDPRTHVRKPELHAFKKLVKENQLPEEFIRDNLDLYCEIRRFHTIDEMAKELYLLV